MLKKGSSSLYLSVRLLFTSSGHRKEKEGWCAQDRSRSTEPPHCAGAITLTASSFCFEVLVGSHAVVRNNTESSPKPLAVYPNGNNCVTTEQHHNQESNIGTICRLYSDFASFTCTPCVCVFSSMQFYHMSIFESPTSQDTE